MVIVPALVTVFDGARERIAAALDHIDYTILKNDPTPTLDASKVAAFDSVAKPQEKQPDQAVENSPQNSCTLNIAPGAIQGCIQGELNNRAEVLLTVVCPRGQLALTALNQPLGRFDCKCN